MTSFVVANNTERCSMLGRRIHCPAWDHDQSHTLPARNVARSRDLTGVHSRRTVARGAGRRLYQGTARDAENVEHDS